MELESGDSMPDAKHFKTQGKIRTLFIYAVRLQALIIILFLGAIIYLSDDALCIQDELKRIASPGNQIDAVLIKKQCYLKPGSDIRLYFLPANEALTSLSGPPVYAIPGGDTELINLRWSSPNEFLLDYENGNFAYEQSLQIEN
jgi:hypothetical protein